MDVQLVNENRITLIHYKLLSKAQEMTNMFFKMLMNSRTSEYQESLRFFSSAKKKNNHGSSEKKNKMFSSFMHYSWNYIRIYYDNDSFRNIFRLIWETDIIKKF